MKRRVIAIGLDSADIDLIERWIDAGQLPHLRDLRARGALCRFQNQASYHGGSAPYPSTEGCWVMFQTGVRPHTSGYWETVFYDPLTYRSGTDQVTGGYDFQQFAPFFALGQDHRVLAFDVPVSAVVPNVNGKQIVGWGGHFPFVRRGSDPAELLEEITKRYGSNKILYRDSGVFWKPKYQRWLEKTSIESIRQRTQMCLDLLREEPWGLFLAVFGETHGASHDLWFASDTDHPLHSEWTQNHDPLLKVFQEVDRAIGKIAAEVPHDANFAVFSLHGIKANASDLACFFFLPELLYRYNFPGQIGFAAGRPGPPGPQLRQGRHGHWFGEIWRRKHANGPLRTAFRKLLPSWFVWPPGGDFYFPYTMGFAGPGTGWMPSVWYRRAWPRMRAFSLPAFSDGHIRVNLQGREAQGIVPASEYEAECDRVSEFLCQVTNARTGKPIVRDVIRTRKTPRDHDPNLPHADLIVVWNADPFDVVDSPEVGRIGPVPFHRSGGHRAAGFGLFTGAQIRPEQRLPNAEVVDLAPTLLQLMGSPIPKHFEGDPLRVDGATHGSL